MEGRGQIERLGPRPQERELVGLVGWPVGVVEADLPGDLDDGDAGLVEVLRRYFL